MDLGIRKMFAALSSSHESTEITTPKPTEKLHDQAPGQHAPSSGSKIFHAMGRGKALKLRRLFRNQRESESGNAANANLAMSDVDRREKTRLEGMQALLQQLKGQENNVKAALETATGKLTRDAYWVKFDMQKWIDGKPNSLTETLKKYIEPQPQSKVDSDENNLDGLRSGMTFLNLIQTDYCNVSNSFKKNAQILANTVIARFEGGRELKLTDFGTPGSHGVDYIDEMALPLAARQAVANRFFEVLDDLDLLAGFYRVGEKEAPKLTYSLNDFVVLRRQNNDADTVTDPISNTASAPERPRVRPLPTPPQR